MELYGRYAQNSLAGTWASFRYMPSIFHFPERNGTITKLPPPTTIPMGLSLLSMLLNRGLSFISRRVCFEMYEFGTGTESTSGKSIGMIVLAMILALGLVASTTIILIQSQQITSLETQVDDLQTELDTLQSDYDDLLSDYNSLFSDMQNLEEAFEEPLTNPTTPSINQVRTWLETMILMSANMWLECGTVVTILPCS